MLFSLNSSMTNEKWNCSNKRIVLFIFYLFLILVSFILNYWLSKRVIFLTFSSITTNVNQSRAAKHSATRTETFLQSYVVRPDSNACRADIKLVVLIKSSVQHFEQRLIIRNTWASVRNVSGNLIQTIFLLGITNNETTDSLSLREASKYHDVVVGAFVDHYTNLTLKSALGLQWVREFCRKTSFVLLGDDDIFLNLKDIAKNYLTKQSFKNSGFQCGVQTVKLAKVKRRGKWCVSFDQYKPPFYPPYCKGPCYIMSAQAATSVSLALNASLSKITVDDALISGIIRQMVNISLHYMPRGFCKNLVNSIDIEKKLIQTWEAADTKNKNA